jgi:sugar lactone lactonase YvrE
MIDALRKAYQSFRGTGEASLTIPALDGAFRPNQAIENAPVLATVERPDNLIVVGDEVQFSSGARRMRLSAQVGVETIETFESAITAMASDSHGRVAVAREGGLATLRETAGSDVSIASPDGGDIVAMAFVGDALILCVGARKGRAAEWRRDLMERGASGSVWRYDISARKLASIAENLAYPSGVLATGDGAVLVSEAWRHRLVKLRAGRAPEIVTKNLPGYPSRLIARAGGGVWLAAMAPRNQLVEFVLREETYRRRMIDEIAPRDWIAPALAPPASFLQPMQQGGQRTLSILKPWAPSFSYGLVIRLDANGGPVESFHSRADGRLHGVTSLAERGGDLIASSQGGDAIVAIPVH